VSVFKLMTPQHESCHTSRRRPGVCFPPLRMPKLAMNVRDPIVCQSRMNLHAARKIRETGCKQCEQIAWISMRAGDIASIWAIKKSVDDNAINVFFIFLRFGLTKLRANLRGVTAIVGTPTKNAKAKNRADKKRRPQNT
jgi:hypothetical protein